MVSLDPRRRVVEAVRARSTANVDPVRAPRAAAVALVFFFFFALAGLSGWRAIHRLEAERERALSLRRAVLETAIAGAPDLEVAAAADAAGARERAAAILAALDEPPWRVELRPVEETEAVAGPARAERVAGLDRVVVVALEPGARERAALAAAAPWLVAALAVGGLVASLIRLKGALARVDGARQALATRLEAEVRLRETAEALEARLAAALDALDQPVALFEPTGARVFANAAFRARTEAAASAEEPVDWREGGAGGRTLLLASGERLVVLPPAAAPRPAAPSAVVVPFARLEGGARLADRLQELAEGLARVAREAVLLHELAPDAASRARAQALRGAVERCTRLLATLLGPGCAPRRQRLAFDQLLEERLAGAAGAHGVSTLLGIAPGLPAVRADPEALRALVDRLLAELAGEGAALRVRLRKDAGSLLLDLEPAHPQALHRLEPAVWEQAAERAGASVALVQDAAQPCVRLRLPVDAGEAVDRLRLVRSEEERVRTTAERPARIR